MNPEVLANELEREPFVPLRLHLADGQHVDIRNPAICHIARLALYIFQVRRSRTALADDVRIIALRQIVSVQTIDAEAA